MKKSKKQAFLCVLWVGMSWAACGQIPANPSFEDPETEVENLYGDLAAHWGRWGAWMNRESAWSPTHSGIGLIGYHHWEIQAADESGLYQDVKEIPAGKNITFSIYAYSDRDTNVQSVELRLEKLGGYEVLASQVYSMEHLKTATWTALSVTGRNVSEGVRVLVIVKPAPAPPRRGAVKFDDAAMEFE
ncbi:MAG: hypothetical protein V2A34_08775 [Lentisphaerota bacterium]